MSKGLITATYKRVLERSLTMHAALKASIGEEAWRDCFACAAMVFDEPGATVIIADPCRRQMLQERFGNALLGAVHTALKACAITMRR